MSTTPSSPAAAARLDGQLADVWRREAPHVLGALTRRFGDVDACEDAVQEALWAASRRWPVTGIPDKPRGWLITAAGRRLLDQRRSDTARRAREHRAAMLDLVHVDRVGTDDSLAVLLWCCHPALAWPTQIVLTLRAVAGLSTAQIAAAHLLPEATVAQRITRGKRILRQLDVTFTPPSPADLPGRVAVAIDVLMVMFAEGHTASSGETLLDVSLTAEAIRLTTALAQAVPHHDEVAAALAWMLLTDARSAARVDKDGNLVPLAEQDRRLWNHAMINEGIAIVERVLPRGPVGPYQLRAAIAAVHAEATAWLATDWLQIRELYRMLNTIAPGPLVTLNRAVAEAMAGAPDDGLRLLTPLAHDTAMRTHHRFFAVRAHLHHIAGRPDLAATDYRTAARLTRSAPEQRYLNAQAATAAAPPSLQDLSV